MTLVRLSSAALALSAAAFLFAGCSSTSTPHVAMPPASSASAPGMDARLTEAVATPLTDLNVVRAKIPPALVAAQKDPYGVPADSSCPSLTAHVQALDAVLGADLDTQATALNPSLIDRGTSAAGDAIVGAVRSSAEDVVPFRGWVRKLSGAERYSRDIVAAINAGTARRSYLKGLGQAAGCTPPAAPRRAPLAAIAPAASAAQ
jgi:hypothetical protein